MAARSRRASVAWVVGVVLAGTLVLLPAGEGARAREPGRDAVVLAPKPPEHRPGREPGRAEDAERNPAVITDNARDPAFYNDFTRITFVPASVEVTTPGRPSALRAFFGATRFYEPPLPVDAIADFNGFAADATRDLVAMSCRPAAAIADPRYATWPNVARMVAADLDARGYACPAPAGAEPANQAYCLARQYRDEPARPAVGALLAAMQLAEQLYALNGGNWLYDNYGMDLHFTGLGMVARGPAVALTAAELLEQLVVPEYLLRNVSLASANCRCIRVPPYPGRDQDLLPVALIWSRGGLDAQGRCTQVVPRLPGERR